MAHNRTQRPANTNRAANWKRLAFSGAKFAALALLCSCRAGAPPRQPLPANGPMASNRGGAPVISTREGDENSTRQAPVIEAGEPMTPLPSLAPVVPASSRRESPPPSPALPHAANSANGGEDVRLVEHLEFTPGPQTVGPTLPNEAWTGYPGDRYTIPGYAGPLDQGPSRVDMPGLEGPIPQWAPPGIMRSWPPDEYIFDGGDRELAVRVDPDFTVRGLDQEDTVVHYDTLDGETIVKPSNRVCIYAPRFASVRKIYGVEIEEQHERMLVVDMPTGLVSQEERLPPTTVNQPLQPELEGGVNIVDTFEEDLRGVEFERVEALVLATEHLLPFEDNRLVRFGITDNTEKARLWQSIEAAIAWTENQAVQVVVDEKPVAVEMGIETAGTLVEIKRYGKPCVRICKLASRKAALPGDLIDFTIRFDNIGTDLAGNVTIVDNLTTRLEYVPNSAQCTLNANFVTQENEGETFILRWEIKDPLPSGKGGVIRFQCRVR